jgi:hypothetical protein
MLVLLANHQEVAFYFQLFEVSLKVSLMALLVLIFAD